MKYIAHTIIAASFLMIAGCATDDSSIDTRPQFDRNGNPNFDTHGNYQGCHGVGCQVDTPDDDNSSNDDDSN